ncbi:MAG TPA: hypothetical protein VM204_02155 [Gaiellaceae bacterium]|nr:hypothetical protein [Gaiellaceae bacterium]
MSLSEDVRDRQSRAAKNQSLFREVNERVKDIHDQFSVITTLCEWACECANDTCFVRLELSGQEYEHVRAAGNRFLVAPGDEHVWPDVERVVERHDGYWIVEKLELGAALARQRDPRSET